MNSLERVLYKSKDLLSGGGSNTISMALTQDNVTYGIHKLTNNNTLYAWSYHCLKTEKD